MALFVHLLRRVFTNVLSHTWGLGLLWDLNFVSIRIREVLLQLTCGGVHDTVSVILQRILFSSTPIVWIMLEDGTALSSP